jgi:hypothetical protein
MHVGDRDGLDHVYNAEGELILKPEEVILVKEEDIVPSLKSSWGYFGGDEILEPSRGTIYLTNMRMVFIAQPSGIQKLVTTEHGIRPEVVRICDITDIKGVDSRKMNVKDYFVVPIREILGCEIRSDLVATGEHINVYILSEGTQYHITFVAPKNSSLLLRLKRKRVDNVNELIKNIKYYAENTGWVTQPEEEIIESTEYRAKD